MWCVELYTKIYRLPLFIRHECYTPHADKPKARRKSAFVMMMMMIKYARYSQHMKYIARVYTRLDCCRDYGRGALDHWTLYT